MITSPTNPKIKFVRALAKKQTRQEKKQFAVEGVRLIEEAVGAGLAPVLAFYTTSIHGDRRARILLDKISALTREVYEVSDAVMREMSETETPQGILAVVPFPQIPEPTRPSFMLILDSIRDPGNLGAILRSARAAGVDAILLAPGTVDPFNDKVVRAGMGAHFSVSIRSEPWEIIVRKARNIPRVYLADAHGAIGYHAADWSKPVALIVGGEAAGASDAARSAKIVTARVRIPMRGGESLNAAMAATVLMFEAIR
jgi:TrmH family RNA methyltransferase